MGDRTLAELAQKHDVHPNMIALWKKQAKERMPELFAKGNGSAAAEKGDEIRRLHEKIGKLSVENDFLAKAFRR